MSHLLKQLSKRDCLHIAHIINPEVWWRMETLPEDLAWDGYNVVNVTAEQKDLVHLVILDYRPSSDIREKYRIRYYYHLEPQHISDMSRYTIREFLRKRNINPDQIEKL